MEIELLKTDADKGWDAHLAESPCFRFSETTNFKNVLQKTYNYKPHYLLIKEDQKIVALLPSIQKKNTLISMPFTDYGDLIILDDNINPNQLVLAIKNYLQQNKIKYLKVVSGLNVQASSVKSHFVKQGNDSRAILTLEKNPDQLLKKFDYSVRKAIKKAQNYNLTCHQDNSAEAIKNLFYPLYLKSMKRFGTPPHSVSYFLNKQKYFGNNLKLFLVKKDNLTISALLGFTCGKNIHITKNPSNSKFWNQRPNDLAHWEFIKWGCEHGFESFDFGPVRYENQKRYKKKWTARILPNYIFYLIPDERKNQPTPSSKTHSPTIKALSLVWKHLIPISLSQYLGPPIRKWMGK